MAVKWQNTKNKEDIFKLTERKDRHKVIPFQQTSDQQ